MSNDISLTSVSYTYPGERESAIRNITLTFTGGTVTAVMGHSGSGKSTLMRILGGIRKPSLGSAVFSSLPSVVFQNPEDQLFEETVLSDVEFGPKNRGEGREARRKAAEEALRETGIDERLWTMSPLMLSGGEKRLCALAGVLALGGGILVLDEITSGLDEEGRSTVYSIIGKLKREGKTVIFTTHDPEEAALYADRVILLENGEVKSDGTILDASEYDTSFMTEGLRLKRMLEEDGIFLSSSMASVSDVLSSLSFLSTEEGDRT